MAVGTYGAIATLFTPTEAGSAPAYYGYWTAQNGGIFVGRARITGSPPDFAANAVVRIPANRLTITVPVGTGEGRLSPAGAKWFLDETLENQVFVSFHSAEPNDDGSNELTIGGYSRTGLVIASWSTVV